MSMTQFANQGSSDRDAAELPDVTDERWVAWPPAPVACHS
jgi:hypothetical protein